jgi:hypothetical protein
MTCHSRKADVGPRAGAVAEGPNADLVRDIVATNGKPPSSPVADAVRRHFPDADDGVCQQIQQAALAVVPAATPDEIALTVLRAFEETPDQRGAVLFVTTVPKKLPQVLRQTRPRSEWPEIEVRPIEVRPPRKPLSKRTRFEVFKRDSFTCQYCGRRPPETWSRPASHATRGSRIAH